jgi:hypothetical protein
MTRFGAIVLTIVVALLMISCVVNSEAARTPPAITAVSPSSVAAGSADFTVAVSGSNFNTRSVVTVNGSPRATAYISQNQLAARILSGDVHQAGTIQLVITGLGTNSTSNPYPLSVTAPLALQIATSSLPNATVQAAYAASVASSGGLAPYNWKVASGQLPAGVALDSSSGILTGVPVQAGKYSFTAQVTDSSSTTQTASQPLNLDVMASSPLVMSSTTLPNGTVQVAYSASLSASGGTQPYTWSVTSGALPPGISLSSSTGALSGTPSQAGGFSFTVQVKDSAATPQTATNTFTITVAAPKLVISTTSLPQGTAGQSYAASLQASGGTPSYTWSVTSGSLPAGLSLASSGAISGTPSSAGSWTFTVQVKDSAATPQTATGTFTITIAAPAPAQLVISTTSLPQGTAGQSYSASLQASGGTPGYTWSVTSGSLPAGLSLASSGAISSTPSSAGSWTFTVQVKDSAASAQTATASFTLTIAPAAAPTISGVSPNAGPTSGGTLVTISGSNFQAGASVSFGGAASPNVLVSGATQIQATTPPLAAGTVSVSVKNPDGQAGTLASAFTFGQGLQITTSSLPDGTLNSSYSASLAAAGGSTPYTWSYSGTLPHCVLLSSVGQLSGTPCVAGTYAFTMMATDASGASTTKQFNIIISGPVLAITTTSLPAPTQSTPYSATLQAGGGTPPYTWSVSSGQLPSGLTLDPSAGTISGTPTATGSFSFTVQVKDVASGQASAPFSLTVSPPGALTIVTQSLPAGATNQPYAVTMVASGGTPSYTWSVSSGQLPPGLLLAASSGLVSGTPTATGQFNFTLSVTDSSSPAQSASLATSVVISNAPALDQYGGWTSLLSPNGATGKWRIEKFGKRWLFVTPDGHGFWMAAVFSVQPIGDPIAKYGSLDVWGVQQVKRLDAWGFNTLGDYAYGRADAWNLPSDMRRMPTLDPIKFSQNVVTNRITITGQQPAPDAVKDLIQDCQDLVNGYTGWRAGLPDLYDPNFDIFVNNTMAAIVADKYGEAIKFTSPWFVGAAADDSDYLFGTGPGLDLPVPDGTIHPHIGWLSLAARPTLTSSSTYGITYKNSTVFTKQQVVTFLKSRYATISALNTAWGSSYTTFDSDGGWPGGRGLTDENGSHTSWLGTRDGTLAGATPGVVKDLDDFLYQWATQYYKTTSTRIRQYLPGLLVFSQISLNGHGGISRKQVLQAAAENCDVLNAAVWTQDVLNLTAQWIGDKPMIPWEGQVANPDSALYAYPNSNLGGVGVWNTQAERGAGYASRMNFLSTATVTATGNQPVIGIKFWSLIDHAGEKIDWGLVSLSDNAYDAKEAVIAIGVDPWGFKTGGEARNYGDFISSVKAANVKALQTICQQLGGCK